MDQWCLREGFLEVTWAESAAQSRQYVLLQPHPLPCQYVSATHERHPRSCDPVLQLSSPDPTPPPTASTMLLPSFSSRNEDVRYFRTPPHTTHACAYYQGVHLRLLPRFGEAYRQYWNRRPQVPLSSADADGASMAASQNVEVGREVDR